MKHGSTCGQFLAAADRRIIRTTRPALNSPISLFWPDESVPFAARSFRRALWQAIFWDEWKSMTRNSSARSFSNRACARRTRCSGEARLGSAGDQTSVGLRRLMVKPPRIGNVSTCWNSSARVRAETSDSVIASGSPGSSVIESRPPGRRHRRSERKQPPRVGNLAQYRDQKLDI